ncbi:MAG: hypothetical protein IIY87_05075 [Bacteroidales bacterium]|nr:hypothetical protein [Bacteroidales bacterium]
MTQSDKRKIEEKIKGYEYIQNNLVGLISELKKNIGEPLVNYFVGAGIIAYGINSNADKRYKVTEKGKRISKIELISLRLNLL